MGIRLPKGNQNAKATVNYQELVSKNLLLIFTRNPVLGKCKTRLATKVGDKNALDIYKFLLDHTAQLTKDVNAVKQLWYSEAVWEDDIWDTTSYDKKLQQGQDLGLRMAYAFQKGFSAGFERIVIIGSDMYDLTKEDINGAFAALYHNDIVIGPAHDGGYYLLGMTHFNEAVFKNKSWGTKTVLQDTLADVQQQRIHRLETRNDIDRYEDIKEIDAFQPFLNNI